MQLDLGDPAGELAGVEYGVSRASRLGAVYRLAGGISWISTLSPSAPHFFAASSRARSFIASTKGVDQWAECRAIRPSVPGLDPLDDLWPTSGRSPCAGRDPTRSGPGRRRARPG